jgi:hypothetical protein
MLLLRVDERRDDLGVCVLQCAETYFREKQQRDGDRTLPLEERLFVPLLIRLIAHHGPRHLLVLLVNGFLRKGG